MVEFLSLREDVGNNAARLLLLEATCNSYYQFSFCNIFDNFWHLNSSSDKERIEQNAPQKDERTQTPTRGAASFSTFLLTPISNSSPISFPHLLSPTLTLFLITFKSSPPSKTHTSSNSINSPSFLPSPSSFTPLPLSSLTPSSLPPFFLTPSQVPYRKVVIEYLNVVFGSGQDAHVWWRTRLPPLLKTFFFLKWFPFEGKNETTQDWRSEVGRGLLGGRERDGWVSGWVNEYEFVFRYIRCLKGRGGKCCLRKSVKFPQSLIIENITNLSSANLRLSIFLSLLSFAIRCI